MRVVAGQRLLAPGWPHVLGTDGFGIDIASRLMVGARTILLVGIISVGVAAVVGVPLGMLAGQAGGWVDEVVMRVSDVVYAFPALLLAMLLAAIYGGSTVTAMVAIGVATIPAFARVARAGTLQVMASDFVLAAKASGHVPVGCRRRHVLPNIAPLVGVQASVGFAMAILAEAALSYLGLATPRPNPDLGQHAARRPAVPLRRTPPGAVARAWPSRWPSSASTCWATGCATTWTPGCGRFHDTPTTHEPARGA